MPRHLTVALGLAAILAAPAYAQQPNPRPGRWRMWDWTSLQIARPIPCRVGNVQGSHWCGCCWRSRARQPDEAPSQLDADPRDQIRDLVPGEAERRALAVLQITQDPGDAAAAGGPSCDLDQADDAPRRDLREALDVSAATERAIR